VAQAHDAGAVTLNYGTFINAIVTFLIIALCVFMIVRMVSKLSAKPVPPPDNMKSCPRCTLSIPKAASRCPNCTSDVAAA
jgi:large conductance mechanosensitive channel